MKKLLIGLLLGLLPTLGMTAGTGVHLEHADIDLSDQASLQRGAKYFFNYCASCHSLQYMRYNRVAHDIGLTEDEVIENFMFAGGKVGNPITTAMDPKEAEIWFGTVPPDLTLVARNRKNGPDWIYTYLKSFYLDPSRPLGVNNHVFPDVGMPHVLWQLQGWQEAKIETVTDDQGHPHEEFKGFEQASAGQLRAEEYDGVILDLTNFLTYIGEPVKLERQQLGYYVLIFLAIFFVVAFLMKKEFWKDVH